MAGPRALKKLGAADDVNRIQDFTQAALAPLIGSAILNGALLTNLELKNGNTIVNHKLGRRPQGYIVVANSSNTPVWGNSWNTTALTLSATGTTTVNLWVF